MSPNGHGAPEQNGTGERRVRYVLFTGKVKHGQMLRYLFAAQARKRFLEQFGWRRQLKASALTGDPDAVLEVYYLEEPDPNLLESTLERMKKDPSYQEIRASRIERHGSPGTPGNPDTHKLIQLRHMLTERSQKEWSRELATAPYLLHVTCTLFDAGTIGLFNDLMSKLLGAFEHAGLSLLISGQDADDDKKVLNIWEYEQPESPKLVMLRLAENEAYCTLDELCSQEQHVFRNISRHYQQYPMLQGIPLHI
jgi:hypothetical protein